MSYAGRLSRALVAAVVVAATVGSAPAAALEPVVFVDPTVAVVDGEALTITGIDSFKSAAVVVGQCAADVDLTTVGSATTSCGNASIVASVEGSATHEWRQLFFPITVGPPIDCVATACVLAVLAGPGINASDPITESALVPIEMADVGFTMNAAPVGNLIHGDVIEVTGTGLEEFHTAEILECIGDPAVELGFCVRSAVPIQTDGSVVASVTANRNLGAPSLCTALVIGPCEVGLLATATVSGREVTVLHSAKLGFAKFYSVSPVAGLVDGQTVSIDTEGMLPVPDDSVTFTMQCAFGAFWAFYCSHAGTATHAPVGSYHDTLAVTRTFFSGEETLTCNDNVVCVIATVTLGPDLSILGVAASRIDFAPAAPE